VSRYYQPQYALGLSVPPQQACLNDRDTLAQEARGLPDALQVVTGRFERNPPLFYEMRLKRVATQLKRDPSQLELYDDAAVASDRLGRSDEAIRWIELKRKQLAPFNAKDKMLREHWYRYYANGGTFWAHRWIRSGADRARIGEMKTATQMIKRAIEIKPNAHFGREKYQLKAMQWIVKPPPATPSPSSTRPILPDFLHLQDRAEQAFDFSKDDGTLGSMGLGDAAQGLAGLIALGNAWESVDVFNTLSRTFVVSGKNSFAYAASLRAQELAHKGRASLVPGAPTGGALAQMVAAPRAMVLDMSTQSPTQLQEIYTRLRTEADEYQKKRTAYMMARLEQGQHPDTYAAFWQDWHDAGPPAPVPFTIWEKHGSAFAIIAAGLLFSLTLLFRMRRRHALAVASFLIS
jgi:tetratricopeptide (TPR) repeat protein